MLGVTVEAGEAAGAGVAVLVAGATGAVLAGFTVSVAGSLQAAKVRDAAKITNSFLIMIFFSSVDSQCSDRVISDAIALDDFESFLQDSIQIHW